MNENPQPGQTGPVLPVTGGVNATSMVGFPSAPYRGIEYFRFVDHPIFFARQTEVIELLRNVIIYKGVLLFGSSGTGKSSIINAGLLPAIINQGFVPDRIRVQNRADQEFVIERISLNDDGQEPFLSPSLADSSSTPGLAVFSVDQFRERVREVAATQRSLLIFDQFEEVITLFEETPHTPESFQEAMERQKRVMDTLVSFLHDDAIRIKILFAFREDYLAKLTKLCLMAPELPNQSQRLNLPRTTALEDVIAGPLKENLLVRYKRKRTFPRPLIDLLIEQFTQRAENDAISLSEVQIVCAELWESKYPAKLFDKRGVQGLLEDYLTRELDDLPEPQRTFATGLLSYMLTSTNTRNFISGVELIRQFQAEEPGVEKQDLEDALRALTGTRLVRRELRRTEYFYEIASEFLVPWIVEQKNARQTKLERIRLEEQLHREHIEERKRAAQRLKYTRWVTLLITVITLLAVLLAIYMFRGKRTQAQLRQDAVTAKDTALRESAQKEQILKILERLFESPPAIRLLNTDEIAKIRTQLNTNSAEGIRYLMAGLQAGNLPPEEVEAILKTTGVKNAELEAEILQARTRRNDEVKRIEQDKLAAIGEMRVLMKEGKFPRKLVLALLSPTLSGNDQSEVARQTRELLTDASRTDTEVRESIADAANQDFALADFIPARVYIQIETDNQRGTADAIKAELEKNNYIVPKYEVVGFRAPRANEIRYYRAADAEKIEKLKDLLESLKLPAKTVYIKGYENTNKPGADNFELWLAAQSTSGEDWYVIVTYAGGAERKQELEQVIGPVVQSAGGQVEQISKFELSIGPYTQAQAREVRQQVTDLNSQLVRRVLVLRR